MTKKISRTKKPAPAATAEAAADMPVDARDKLLRALLEVVSEQGFGDASVKAIAARAGVNHGLIHYYFGGKDGLVLEAVRRWNEGSLGALAAFRARLRPEQYWATLWQVMRKDVKHEPLRYRLAAQITAASVLPAYSLPSEVSGILDEWIVEFADMLVADQGRRATAADIALARAMNGAISAIGLWAIRNPQAGVDAALDAVEAMFATAFGRPAPRKTPRRNARRVA